MRAFWSECSIRECSTSWEDVVEGARLAWQHAFTARLIRKSWRAVGLIPFTRRVEIKLRRKEAAHSLSVSKAKVKVMSLNTALKFLLRLVRVRR